VRTTLHLNGIIYRLNYLLQITNFVPDQVVLHKWGIVGCL